MAFVCRLDPRMGVDGLKRAWARHRFDVGRGIAFNEFEEVALAMNGLSDAAAYYLIKPEKKEIFAVVTLGRSFDGIQEKWSRDGELLRAYMADCIGMELLTAACREFDAYLYEETGLWIGCRRFPGEGMPLCRVGDILGELSVNAVTCNKAYVMTPKKSVAFSGVLTRKKESDFRPCSGCDRIGCPSREGDGDLPER